jgi:Tfp pilus assembly protein PilF
LARNDFDGAIAAAQQVLELDSGDILAWTTLARAYQRKGMITEAKHAGEKAQILGSKKQFQE